MKTMSNLFKCVAFIWTCNCLCAMAISKDEYLALIDKVASNDVDNAEILDLAIITYNGFERAKIQKKEVSETTQRALDILIRNGRYIQAIETEIKTALGKFENGRWVEMPSSVTLEGDFGALGIIKTPESAMLCGKYLTEPTMQSAPPRAKQVTGECWTPNNAGGPSYYAARALQDMGIKNAPAETKTGYPVIALWQEWFEEVKSGARTFAFEGQEVAYRLKPDGSIESLDAKSADQINQRIRPRAAVTTENPAKESKQERNWIVFGALFVVLCITYCFKFRRAGAKS